MSDGLRETDQLTAVAQDVADRLSSQAGVAVVGIYLRDRRGAHVLVGASRSHPSNEPLHPRLWSKEGPEWAWGGDGHYRLVPFRQSGEEGTVVLGPFPTPQLGRRAVRRRFEQSVPAGIAELARRISDSRARAEEGRQEAERQAYRLGRRIDGTNAVLLEAARRELDAAAVAWDGEGLVVTGQRGGSPLAVSVLESWLSTRPPVGNPELHRQITAYALADLVDARSADTAWHSQRVANLAVVAGAILGLSVAQLETVEAVARLENVGMGFLGKEAVNRARLTDHERQALERHPILGAALLAGAGFPGDVVAGVRAHHERWDGEGYPENMQADEIPLSARLVGCADVFVALVSPRPWRCAMDVGAALEHLRRASGRQFDAATVAAVASAADSPLFNVPLAA